MLVSDPLLTTAAVAAAAATTAGDAGVVVSRQPRGGSAAGRGWGGDRPAAAEEVAAAATGVMPSDSIRLRRRRSCRRSLVPVPLAALAAPGTDRLTAEPLLLGAQLVRSLSPDRYSCSETRRWLLVLLLLLLLSVSLSLLLLSADGEGTRTSSSLVARPSELRKGTLLRLIGMVIDDQCLVGCGRCCRRFPLSLNLRYRKVCVL